MNLGTAARQPAAGSGGRFYLIGYLPAYAAALFLLLLVWAGAPAWRGRPGRRIRFTTAWATASHLSLGEVVMLALAVALLAVILQPLQLALVNLAQGSWPRWLRATWARQRQKNRRDRLARAAHLPPGPDLTSHAIQRAGEAGFQLRRRFPVPDHLLQPTTLGNVLAALQDTAGRAYGLDAVIAWPRLYPVLGEQCRTLVDDRAEAQADRDALASQGLDTADLDERIAELDQQITEAEMRGTVLPVRPRRHRSTRRRHDAAPLPRRAVSTRTIGKTYTAPDGKVFRPSLFVTLTCPSYGRVTSDGTPVNSDGYDYTRAARDALHFAALFDRFIQNLRRFCGYDVQYFAAVEPQRRLAPHVHIAIRGTISRTELREVLTATYHQVWWPSIQTIRYDGDHLPIWDETSATYLDPGTGEVLPTWDEALGAIGNQDEPQHVVRFGDRFDAQGVLAGSRDASRCIGYLTKYLTKHVRDCHQASTEDQAAHADRLTAALRYEPCSPTCANWLRYGIQPKNARPGLCPGCCKGKAHSREHLGYGGRRVLVSRKWSGKTLADHRGDRKAWLTGMLGISATDPSRYTWEPVKPGDPDHMPSGQRLLHVVADRIRWQTALEQARRRAATPVEPDPEATGRAA